eukprot:c14955_g1_i1 orf=1-159(-)
MEAAIIIEGRARGQDGSLQISVALTTCRGQIAHPFQCLETCFSICGPHPFPWP